MDVTATSLEEKVSKPLKIAILGFWHGHEKDYARSTKQHPGADLVLLDAVLQTCAGRGPIATVLVGNLNASAVGHTSRPRTKGDTDRVAFRLKQLFQCPRRDTPLDHTPGPARCGLMC